MGFLLGIDIGTSATKALLCDEAGKVLATASQPYQLYAPRPGWSEQAPTDWFNATLHTIAAVCKLARRRPAEISGIGLSGQMHGSVFVGRNGRPLRRALLWNDQRTAQQCAQIERAVGGRKRLIAMVSNAALTGFTAPKILWVRTHQPRIYDRTHKILLPKDYIRLCLTGQYATDVSDASGTILLDVRRRRWHHRLLARLGINPDLLPTCYESVQITGQLTRHASRLTGIPAGTPVVAGAGDQPAGAVGTGVIRSGVVSATIGTSGVVFAHCDQPAPNTHANLQSFCHAVPGKWCVFGCMLAAGASLQWLRDTLFAEQVARLRRLGHDPGQLYPHIIADAARARPGCDGLLFLPYLTGERCPHPDPHARAGWIGLTWQHDRATMIRAVLEGITYGMRDQLEIMRAQHVPIRHVRAGGGAARSPYWLQLQADIYALPVSTINTQEGAAYGVALLAAVATGCFSSITEACDAAIKITSTCRPNRRAVALYQPHYRRFRQLYPLLKDHFHALAANA